MSETYVIVGAGHCAGQLIARLRAEGFTGHIRLIGDEAPLPYQRPPLSKAFLAGEVDIDRVLLRPADFYEKSSVETTLGTEVVSIECDVRKVTLRSGEQLGYDKLVLTTGSRVRKLPLPGADLDGVHYLRSLADSEAIRARLKPGARLVVIGGGYIGLEVAAIAVGKQVVVTILEAEPRLLSRVAAPEVASFFAQVHSDAGVAVVTSAQVSAIVGTDKVEKVLCADGSEYPADLVVVGIGVLPNSELAADAGLATDNGIVVDTTGATSDEHIYAAGDCTSHPSELYGRRVRLESVHNAMAQAKVVAANLCAKEAHYAEVPWFWSDQYDLKLQIAGLSQGYDQTVLRGDPAQRSFTLFYLRDGVIIAADSVSAMPDHMACRALITKRSRAEPSKLADLDVVLKELVNA